ncbi:MAG: hypothetical protein U0043_05360 [Streptococcus sp.]
MAIPVTLQLIFFLYPLINGVFYSLTDQTGLTKNFNVTGLANYVKIFQDQAFYKSLGFTILFTIGSGCGGNCHRTLDCQPFSIQKILGSLFLSDSGFFIVYQTVTIGLSSAAFNYGILGRLWFLLGIGLLSSTSLFQENTCVWSVLL